MINRQKIFKKNCKTKKNNNFGVPANNKSQINLITKTANLNS